MRRFLISLIFALLVGLAGTSEARKLALLVGVDEYENVPMLKCCVNDMNTLKNALIKVGFEEDDIQILTTGSSVRNMPTKQKIEQRIARILSEAQARDLVLIAFSGHGAQEGKNAYFCPPFADPDDLQGTCVSITKMMNDLAECPAKFKWVVVDACRNDPTEGAKGIGSKGLQTVPAPPKGIALFQSCAEGEESWEDRTSGNGYFTKNFAEALSGKADLDRDGQLTLMEVCKWTTSQTKEQVMANQKKVQKPYFSGSVSDFILAEDLNVPKAQALAEEARKAVDTRNYALAVEKFDAALALCPQFDYWKRERDLAKLLLESAKSEPEVRPVTQPTSQPNFQPTQVLPPIPQSAPQPALQPGPSTGASKPTRRTSFEWEGTKITQFVGTETEVVIPEGTTEIGNWAFSTHNTLKSVVIPGSVKVIGEYAFYNCKALTSIAIPGSVKTIGQYAFSDCNALMSLTISEGVNVIGDGVFNECSSLTSVVIPESVTEIGESAFCGCSVLTSIVIPGRGTKINGTITFYECPKLTIHAPAGSDAERYAKEQEVSFQAK